MILCIYKHTAVYKHVSASLIPVTSQVIKFTNIFQSFLSKNSLPDLFQRKILSPFLRFFTLSSFPSIPSSVYHTPEPHQFKFGFWQQIASCFPWSIRTNLVENHLQLKRNAMWHGIDWVMAISQELGGQSVFLIFMIRWSPSYAIRVELGYPCLWNGISLSLGLQITGEWVSRIQGLILSQALPRPPNPPGLEANLLWELRIRPAALKWPKRNSNSHLPVYTRTGLHATKLEKLRA